jgi:hypothetical protein
VNQKIKEVELSAVVIKKNGERKDLGTIGYSGSFIKQIIKKIRK